ncbi:MAG: CAP domain-containing protein [Cyanobacteria bacterium J06650_10]
MVTLQDKQENSRHHHFFSMLKILQTPLNLPLRRIGLAAGVTLLATACSGLSENTAFLPSLLPNTIAQAQPAPVQDWPLVERGIIEEHNRIRQNPQSYIPILEAYLASMDAEGNIPGGCGARCILLTEEGKPAVEEAIAFLQTQPAVGPLDFSANIAQAAKSHANEQQGGAIGHASANGDRVSDRLAKSGVESITAGENIDYGSTSAQDVLISLLVDDGVPDRGHRINLFRPEWTTAGAGCGPHATIRTVCVVNYANMSRQLTVVNNGTVDMLSLQVNGTNLLGESLVVGESREIAIAENQSCETTATLQISGGYNSLVWNNVTLCGGTMTLEADNSLSLRY